MNLDLSVVISAAIATALFGILVASTLFVFDRRRAARYDREEQRAELEALRSSLESRIYDLSKRQVATESRWRDANHLLIDSQSYQAAGSGSQIELTPFLRSAGLVKADLKIDQRLVFVLTPFNSEFRDTFEEIAATCSELGLIAQRGDEEYVSSNILLHILKLMVQARLVIANVDGRNPNVFYELGIAHALNKPTILVGSSAIDLPFDVRSHKIVLAANRKELRGLLTKEISRALL